MNTKTIEQIIYLVGLIVVAGFLIKLAAKLFIPLVVLAIGAYIWQKYFRQKV